MADTTLRISNRSIVRAVVIMGAFFVVATVASRATGTIGWFFEAAVFAALGYPLVQRLGRHMPKFVAILLLTGIVAALAGVLGATGLTEMQAESTRFQRSVPSAVRELESNRGIGAIIKDLKLADDIEDFADEISDRLRFRHADVPGIASKVGGSASAVFVVWILTVMLVFTGPTMINGMLGQTPAANREQLKWVLSTAYSRSVRYLGLMTVRALVVGLVTFTVSTSLDIDMPGLLATVAALLSFVPYVGIIGGALPLALMASLNGPDEAIWVLVGGLALQAADALVVQRRIDAATVPLGVFPTLVAAMIGYSLRGPGGLLVAIAIMSLLISVVNDAGALQILRGDRSDGVGPGDADPDALVPALDATNGVVTPPT
jgi:predicted PurR-regulated permease PerM